MRSDRANKNSNAYRDETQTELDFLDGAIANTVVASKAVIYGSLGEVAATTLDVSSTSQFDNFIAVSTNKGFAAGTAGIGGLTYSVTTTSTLAIATKSVQVGKFVLIAADAQTLTLPQVVIGASFIIVNGVADGGAELTISPHADDRFLVDIAGAAGEDDKDIINTKVTQKQNDYVHLIGAHADGWLIHDIRGTWVDEV